MIGTFTEWMLATTRRLVADGHAQGTTSPVSQLSEQPAKLRRQRRLAVMIAALALIGLYVFAILTAHIPALTAQHDHVRCYVMIAAIVVTGLGYALAHRDRVMEGLWVICFGVIGMYIILQISSEVGIRSPSGAILLSFIPLSAFVGGVRNMQPVFFGIVATFVLTYIAERAGFLEGMSGYNIATLEAALVVQLMVGAGLYMLGRIAAEALDLLANLPHEGNRVISHELRQPLSTVVAAVQVLSHPHLSDAMRTRTLKNLANATGTMMALLDNIADHGKLASGQAQLLLAPFSPAALTQEVYGMYEGTAQQKGVSPRVRIDIDERLVLVGDSGRLTQILSNLMDNAVKFTEHGEVTLAVSGKSSPDQPDHLRLRFTIMDTGEGIPKDRQRKIFEAFSKADDERFNQPGMGLGLTIAKQLTDLMGGHLSLESTRGRGSMFCVELDLPVAGSGTARVGKPSEANA